MEELPPAVQLVIAVVVLVLGPAGAAHVAVRTTLNGTRDSVRRIEGRVNEVDRKLDGLTEGHSRIREDVARLKGQLGAS